MTIPTITSLPVPPTRSDATNFASRADTFLGALPTFQTETNAAITEINSLVFPAFFRNRIVNGDFSVWQRGATQTSDGYGSDDRWLNAHVGSTKTASRQAFALGQTAVPGNPAFYSRTVVASVAGAANAVAKQQRLENVRTFAGQNVRVSFWAKADASRPIAIDFIQRFGTGGSPSTEVSGIGAQKFALTTSWQKFTATVAIPSITGKTLGSSDTDSLELSFWFDAGSTFNSRTSTLGQQSGTFDLALVQLEEGSTDTAFEFRPPGVELALCQRYGRDVYVNAVVAGFVQDYGFAPMRAAPAISIVSSAWTGAPAFTATSSSSFRQTAYVGASGSGSLFLSAEL